MPAITQIARIEVFRPGTFTPMVGEAVSYSAEDLRAIAASYDAEAAPAPIVVGHPKTDTPAFGWATSFDYDETSERLFATIGDMEPAFAEAVKAKRYRRVSMSFFRPDASNNPKPGGWYPKHIGFLGGAAPSVSGLKPVAFADDAQALTFEFGEPGFEQTASILRNLRDFFIEKFGLETADKVLPAYQLEWLDDTEIVKPVRTPSFTEPSQEHNVTKPNEAEFAAREAGVTAREQRLAERERQLRRDDNVAFAETLVSEGRLLPASKDKVVTLLDAASAEASVSFAGAAEVSFADALRGILKEQPTSIEFGKQELGDDPDAGNAVAFSSDGKQVDPDRMAIHARALAFQRTHPGTDYATAIDAVS